MRKLSGYIQVHRKLKHSLVFQDPYYLKLWLWLLFRARYKRGTVLIGNQVIQLEIGQLIWGREEASAELNQGLKGKNQRSTSTWETYLKTLEKMGKLTRQPNNKFTLVTICNYRFYQLIETSSTAVTQQQTDNYPTPNKPQTNTNNKENKVNKENKAKSHSKYNQVEKKEESVELPQVPLYNWLHPEKE